MEKIKYAQKHVFNLLNKHGINLFDLPDFDWFNWIEEDMTEKHIKSIIPDIAWEILDNSGMNRDLVNSICYPENG